MAPFEIKFGPEHKRAIVGAVLDNTLGEKCSGRRAIKLAAQGKLPSIGPFTVANGTAYAWINAEKDKRAGLSAARRAKKDVGDSVRNMTERLAVLHEAELRDLERQAEKDGTLDHSKARELLRNLKLISDLQAKPAQDAPKGQGGTQGGETPAVSSTLGRARAAMAAEEPETEGPSDERPETETDQGNTETAGATDASAATADDTTRQHADGVTARMRAVGGVPGDAGLRRLELAGSGPDRAF